MDIDKNKYLANCTAETETILDYLADCVTSTTPNLVYYKSPKSSVEWTNEDLNDYYILRE